MSWTCPYEASGYCKRINKPCRPGIKGCILKDKVRFLDSEEDGLTDESQGCR